MKFYRTFFFGVILSVIAITSVQAQKTVLHSKDLYSPEFSSWFDVLNHSASGWMNATNDDVTVQFSRNGLAGIGGAWFPVYLDGVELHIQSWNTQSLHIIPISVSQADSIVIVETPTLFEGEFTEKGGIFIYSQKPENGINVKANMFMGNRSGDPGPFVYTEMASRNIERIGPELDAMLSYRKDDFYVQTGAKQFVLAVTDPLQFSRMTPFEFGDGTHRHEKIRSTSFYLNSKLKTGSFTHQLQSAYTESGDFFFTELYGTEIPIERKWSFISVAGKGKLVKNLTLNYGLSLNSNFIKEYPNKEDKWLRWNQKVHTLKASLNHNFQMGFQNVGIKAEVYALDDGASSNRSLRNSLVDVHHQLGLNLAEKWNFYSNLNAVMGQNFAFKSNGGLHFKLDESNSFIIDGTYSQRLPEEDNSLWFWMTNKGFAADTLSAFMPNRLPEKSEFIQAKINWKTQFSDNIKFDVLAVFSKNRDEYIFEYDLIPAGQRIQSGNSQFISDLDASFFSIPAKVKMHLSPKIYNEISYTWTWQLTGQTSFFEMIPQHRLFSYMNWVPVESFKIWARFRAQSPSKWQAVDEIDQHEVRVNPLQTEAYLSENKARFQMDFGIKKYFWQKRIAFSLEMQNINNTRFRNHPVSPQHAFTVFLGMHLDLN